MAASVLLYWLEENLWTIQSVSSITEPKKRYGEVFQKGETVKARHSGMIYPGMIMHITEDKDEIKNVGRKLQTILEDDKGPIAAKEILMALELVEVGESETGNPKSDTEPMTKAKKRAAPEKSTEVDEAKSAKKDAAQKKREKGKKLSETALNVSLGLLTDTTGISSKMDEVLAAIKNVADQQEQLLQRFDVFMETVQCRDCLKSMYKGSKKILPTPTSSSVSSIVVISPPSTPGPSIPELSSTAPSTPRPSTPGPSVTGLSTPRPSTPRPSMPGPSVTGPSMPGPSTPGPSTPGPTMPGPSTPRPSMPGPSTPGPSMPGPTMPGPSTPRPSTPGPSTPGPSSTGLSDLASNDCNDLVSLGDAKFGIMINHLELVTCLEHSSNENKLALNLLDYLVTAEDCKDMTIYGHGKEKQAMNPQLRKAIRSQIFSVYHRHASEEEKGRLWGQMVYKMNDKIMGLKNGKYKSKKKN